MNTKPIKNHNQIVRPFFTAFRDASASLSSERAETPLWLCEEATYFVTNKVYADGKGPTYSYTPAGHPLRRVWARGVATDYAYDASGALSNIAYSDDTPSVAYARDRLGRVVRAVVEGVSTNEYAYSLSGLLTNEVQNGVVLSRTYGDFSRATGYVLHDGLLGA